MRWPNSPTADLLAIFVLVYGFVSLGSLFGLGIAWFGLAWPLQYPWTIATSVYTHAGLTHLLTNAISLVVIGFALERRSSRPRFHAFVLVTGALAGLSEVLVGVVVGQSTLVLGASGAILALYGYVLTSNRVSGTLIDRLDVDRRTIVVVLLMIVVAVTVLTAGPGVALVAHATGFLLGLIAGRRHLLQVD